jgi:hypothetical protein
MELSLAALLLALSFCIINVRSVALLQSLLASFSIDIDSTLPLDLVLFGNIDIAHLEGMQQ